MSNTMAIHALEERRYAAMMVGDVAALDALLDDELTYVHSNGLVQTKADYLESFRRGLRKYESIGRDEVKIDVRGDAALVHAKLHIRARLGNASRVVDTFALAVWIRKNGSWRLLALHSTALARA